MTRHSDLLLADKYFEEGENFLKQVEYAAALGSHKKALQLRLTILGRMHSDTAQSYHHTGMCYIYNGNVDAALQNYQQALEIRTAVLGELHPNTAHSCNNVGLCYNDKGDYDQALEFEKKALKIRLKVLGEMNQAVASSYNNLGTSYYFKGNNSQALYYHQKALKIRLEVNGKTDPFTARSYTNVGVCHGAKGDYNQALLYYQKSLDIFLKVLNSDHPNLSMTYYDMSTCYHFNGDFDRSLKYQKKALSIRLKVFGANHPLTLDCYDEVGVCYLNMGDLNQALQYYEKALEFRLQLFGENHPSAALSYYNIGGCYGHQEQDEKALDFHQKALKIRLKTLGLQHPYTALSFQKISDCFLKQKDYVQALEVLQKAFHALINGYSNSNIYHHPSPQNYSDAIKLLKTYEQKALLFYQLYRQSENLKDLKAACQTHILALQLITQMRQSYKTEGSKFLLAKNTRNIFDQAIQTSLDFSSNPRASEEEKQTTKKLAFDLSEQSKSILLFSSLKETEAKATVNIPGELLEKEKQLKIELNYLDKSIATQEGKGNKKDKKLLSKFQSQYFDYKQQYNRLIEQFEADYPEYYHLKYDTESITTQEVQQYLAQKQGAALISYIVGTQQIYIFALTKSSYEVYTISKPHDFPQIIERFRRAINGMSRKQHIKWGSYLYKLLLQPVLESSAFSSTNIQQLILIPDAELNYIPFETLLTEAVEPKTAFAELPYLLLNYEVSYHYSATLLLHTHQTKTKRVRKASGFVGFAPVYANHGKVAKADSPHPTSSISNTLPITANQPQNLYLAQATRSVSIEGKDYQELIYSEQEVSNICRLFEQHGEEATALLHQQATIPNFKTNIQNCKYILVAAHGILNTNQPKLSGILFSPAPNAETEESTEDKQPVFYISDAYHLDLNADLVVLSSCESGIGNLAKGEGMMAMNRGLLYAGASNIIYTLFKVYDQASGELTKSLFEGILEGMSYSLALRIAKKKLIQQPNATPKTWAGFVLVSA